MVLTGGAIEYVSITQHHVMVAVLRWPLEIIVIHNWLNIVSSTISLAEFVKYIQGGKSTTLHVGQVVNLQPTMEGLQGVLGAK